MTVKLDTTLKDFEEGGGEQKFIRAVAESMGVDHEIIAITDKWEGSVYLKLRVLSDGSVALETLMQNLKTSLASDLGYPIVGFDTGDGMVDIKENDTI